MSFAGVSKIPGYNFPVKPTTRYQCVRCACQNHPDCGDCREACLQVWRKERSNGTRLKNRFSKRHLYDHAVAGLLSKTKLEEVLLKFSWRKHTKLWNVFVSTENQNDSRLYMWTTARWLQKESVGPIWKNSARRMRPGRSPLLNQVYHLGGNDCSYRFFCF